MREIHVSLVFHNIKTLLKRKEEERRKRTDANVKPDSFVALEANVPG